MLNTQAVPDKEFLSAEADDNQQVTFTGLEWKFFVLELKDMIAAGEFDVAKAMHNARFYAEIERRTQRIKAGHWTEHELIEVDDDE
ncbi:MAG: hypothetical protein SR1Q7_05510 [Quinella sp. 1Q7]|nr:hypothetical protein [Quinella sp. 1Q7]